jgi:hypothetical protein
VNFFVVLFDKQGHYADEDHKPMRALISMVFPRAKPTGPTPAASRLSRLYTLHISFVPVVCERKAPTRACWLRRKRTKKRKKKCDSVKAIRQVKKKERDFVKSKRHDQHVFCFRRITFFGAKKKKKKSDKQSNLSQGENDVK